MNTRRVSRRVPAQRAGQNRKLQLSGQDRWNPVRRTWDPSRQLRHLCRSLSYCAAQKRLPTEAEWEKAALNNSSGVSGTSLPTCDRAVVNGWYYNPNDIDANANGYVEGYGCGRDGTWDVLGTGFEAGISPYGGVHMSGNVTEWVSDWYSEDYTALIDQADPQGVTEGELRAARGGSWSSFKVNLRAANRGYFDPLRFSSSFGFRCAKNAPDLAEE